MKTDEEIKKENPELYRVARQKGTEPAFTGKYDQFFEKGVYKCAVCGNELFISDTKFDAKCGWPSFYAPASKESVKTAVDTSYGMKRVEVFCPKCGAHLGHVFEDGPEPTGQRFCINSVSLDFEKKEDR
jgi:peptide-methionine (R)-S-oxide reductase